MADKQPEGFRTARQAGDEDDVEGHRKHYPREGNVKRAPREGILHRTPRAAGDEDDVEGHAQQRPREGIAQRPREGFMREGLTSRPRVAGDEDDVEGHSMLPNAGLSRPLAQARERDIQQHLKRHDFEADARAAKKERH